MERFLATLHVAAKESRHLEWRRQRLFSENIDKDQVDSLPAHPDLAERLGVLEDVTAWLEARQLRNRLIHEYMTDSEAFAADLNLAKSYSRMLIDTYRRLLNDAAARLKIPDADLPSD